MVKRILTLAVVALSLTAIPSRANSVRAVEIVEQTLQNIEISVAGSNLHITGASGQMLYIYNVTGVIVKSVRVDSNDKRFELNLQKGCYIVKVGRVVRKISIR